MAEARRGGACNPMPEAINQISYLPANASSILECQYRERASRGMWRENISNNELRAEQTETGVAPRLSSREYS